jgi:hypothetical protein
MDELRWGFMAKGFYEMNIRLTYCAGKSKRGSDRTCIHDVWITPHVVMRRTSCRAELPDYFDLNSSPA